MADIFISYSHHDRTTAADLAGFLDSCGYSVWWDYELVGGTKYRKEIKAQLDSAKAAIVIWTAQSVESEYVLDEAEDAKSQHKLLPVRDPNLEFKNIPFGFRQLQTDPVTKPDLILRSLDEHKVVPSRPPTVEATPVVIGERGVDPSAVAEARQFAAWEFIKDSPDAAKFRAFNETYPGSPLSELARARLGKLAQARWPQVQASGDPAALRQFIADFPGADGEGMARRILMGLESKAWYAISDKPDAAALSTFLGAFPNGPFAVEARHRLDGLKASELEQRAWADIVAAPTKDKLEAFLAAYPLGVHAGEARTLLTDAIRSETRTRRWNEIKSTAYLEQLRTFIADYDSGPEAEQARTLLAEKLAEREEQAWMELGTATSPLQVLQFLESYPDGQRKAEAVGLLEQMPAKVMTEARNFLTHSTNAVVVDAAARWIEAQRAVLPTATVRTAPPTRPSAAEAKPGSAEAAANTATTGPDTAAGTSHAVSPPDFGQLWVTAIGGLLLVALTGAFAALESTRTFASFNVGSTSFNIAISVFAMTASLTAAVVIVTWRTCLCRWSSPGAQHVMAGRHALALAVLTVYPALVQSMGRSTHRQIGNLDNVDRGFLGIELGIITLPLLFFAAVALARWRFVYTLYGLLLTLVAAVALLGCLGTWGSYGPTASDYFLTRTLWWYSGVAVVCAWVAFAVAAVKLRRQPMRPTS